MTVTDCPLIIINPFIIVSEIGSTRPQSLIAASNYDPRSTNYDRTLAAFTKVRNIYDLIK
jgi:hypothetical protein